MAQKPWIVPIPGTTDGPHAGEQRRGHGLIYTLRALGVLGVKLVCFHDRDPRAAPPRRSASLLGRGGAAEEVGPFGPNENTLKTGYVQTRRYRRSKLPHKQAGWLRGTFIQFRKSGTSEPIA